jgi:hypothetical protein
MAQTQNSIAAGAFKPGERIAVPALPVLRIENDIAVLKKMRPVAQGGCGARHQVRVEAPFFIRGGFKVHKTTKFKVPGWAFTVTFETPWGTVRTENAPQRDTYLDRKPDSDKVLAEMLVRQEYSDAVKRVTDIKTNEPIKIVNVYVRKFKHAVVEMPEDDYLTRVDGPYYFVYEFVTSDEARLIDDVSRIDYVLYIFEHKQESRVGCATIKLLSDAVWSNVRNACCRIESYAVAIVIARYGSRVTVARNYLPYRGCCEEWEIEEWKSVFPPQRITSYRSTEPAATSVSFDEVV